MQIQKLREQYLALAQKQADFKIKINFKNACLVTSINIINVVFFIAVAVWIGVNVKWQLDLRVIINFIKAEETKSIGWGLLLSLLIFTVIDGVFYIFVYFNIFVNSLFLVSTQKIVSKHIKVLSVFNIITIVVYSLGWVVSIIGFIFFLYYADSNTFNGSIVNIVNWNIIAPSIISLLPFFLVLFTFIAVKKSNPIVKPKNK